MVLKGMIRFCVSIYFSIFRKSLTMSDSSIIIIIYIQYNIIYIIIIQSLKQKNNYKNIYDVMQSYFDNRRKRLLIIHSISAGHSRMPISLSYRNFMFDCLLRLCERKVKNRFVAYANGLVLIKGVFLKQIENGKQMLDLIVK